MTDNILRHAYLGQVDFHSAFQLQEKILDLRQKSEADDTLLFLEHPPTFTLGKRGNRENLQIPEEELSKRNVRLVHTDRGGDITFHGPGQLVVYPIIKLDRHYRGVKKYICFLEETLITTIKKFGVSGRRDPKYPGVWVENKKIAALGVRVQRGITKHGVALNVNPQLDYFQWIVPCGIQNRGVTSLEECCDKSLPMEELTAAFLSTFANLFDFQPVEDKESILQSLNV